MSTAPIAARHHGAAAVMLGLGIGLSTAMFTVVDALMLRPVPFRDPDRLANVAMMNSRGGRLAVAPAVLDGWRASPAFEAVEGTSPGNAIIETEQQALGTRGHHR
ncbi:MAG TPA: hypothetical protein VFT47_02855 [Vicinamibacterales bacterium]|nr:hypothetical protein [Vicinamibacterales bacterium]